MKKAAVVFCALFLLVFFAGCFGQAEQPEPDPITTAVTQTEDHEATEEPMTEPVTLPDPYFADNGLVWNIAPTLAYEQIHQCICGKFLVSGTWQMLDTTSGETMYDHDAHGGGGTYPWFYDPALGMLGNPGRFDGYGVAWGMHPINAFEESVVNEFSERFQDHPEHFPEWFVEASRGRVVVQMADSTQREIIDEGWGDEEWWALTQEGRLGRFAIMENRELISPWFDAITFASGWSEEWIGYTPKLFAAQQGDA